MSDCIFCKIANGELGTEFVYENEEVVAFKDLNPAAKIHFLIIPRKHYDNVLEIKDPKVMEKIFEAIHEIAKKYDMEEKGFRLINNCKEYGGQEVMHMHIHMLGGEELNHSIN